MDDDLKNKVKAAGGWVGAMGAAGLESAKQIRQFFELIAADYEEVLADQRRLVRELDVLLNGVDGAAKQASLCDIVAQVKREGIKARAAVELNRAALQAKIDALMLEYCPDEMTQEQKDEWAKHQRPVELNCASVGNTDTVPEGFYSSVDGEPYVHPAYGSGVFFTEDCLRHFATAAPQPAVAAVPEGHVRYCHNCGHIGEVIEGARDCCPDGIQATYVRPEVSEQAEGGFNAMLAADTNAVRDAAQAIMAVAMDEAIGRVHVCDRDNSDIKARTMSEEMQSLYLALKSTAPAQANETKPDPKNCTALVKFDHGVITTESCVTKRPLIDKGSSHDDERDYYDCPDCGKHITIDYREN